MLRMWTVYKHPKDYPSDYVARLWEVNASGPVATASVVIAPSLEFLREQMMEMGLVMMTRSPKDDPVIVETWL
jgi:hypothetical protein